MTHFIEAAHRGQWGRGPAPRYDGDYCTRLWRVNSAPDLPGGEVASRDPPPPLMGRERHDRRGHARIAGPGVWSPEGVSLLPAVERGARQQDQRKTGAAIVHEVTGFAVLLEP